MLGRPIHELAVILSEDHSAAEKREQIYSQLGLPPGELNDLKRRLARDNGGSYEFFVHTLNTFHSRNGSTGAEEKLMECFEKLHLTSVVGNLHISIQGLIYVEMIRI